MNEKSVERGLAVSVGRSADWVPCAIQIDGNRRNATTRHVIECRKIKRFMMICFTLVLHNL